VRARAIYCSVAATVSGPVLSHGLHSPSWLSAWWKQPVCSAPQRVENGAYRESPQRWQLQSVSRRGTRISRCRWFVVVKSSQRRMLVDFKSSQPGCCKCTDCAELQKFPSGSTPFYRAPNGLMEPGSTRLPAQPTRLAPHHLQTSLYSSAAADEARKRRKCGSRGVQFLGSFDEPRYQNRARCPIGWRSRSLSPGSRRLDWRYRTLRV
jgi:hypothetical protein